MTGPRRIQAERYDDFERAIERTLVDGETVLGIWQVAPVPYLLGLFRVSWALKLGALPVSIALAYGVSVVQARGRGLWDGILILPTDPLAWCCLVGASPLLLLAGHGVVSAALRVATARYVLTDRRWLHFQNPRERGWLVGQVQLAHCAWRLEPSLLTIYERSARGELWSCVRVLGLVPAETLRAPLELHAGPELDPAAHRELARQFAERDGPLGGLVRVFRRRVEPTWSTWVASAPLTLGGIGARVLGFGALIGLGLRPATAGQWWLWALLSAVTTVASLAFRPERRALFVCVAAGHWWRLRRVRILGDHFEPAEGLPLAGLAYVVHHGAVYTGRAPVEVDRGWITGTTDTLAELAAAVDAQPPAGDFSPVGWHRLDRAKPSLLRALDAAGARRHG